MQVHRLYRYLGIAGAVLVPAVAVATLLDLTEFEPKTPISSDAVNKNFAKLNEKLDAIDGILESIRPVGRYCGASTGSSTGDLGGYLGAKLRCGTTGGACGTDAHLCTASELVLSTQEGQGPDQTVWYASGVWQAHATTVGSDCDGYTSTASDREGSVWTASGVPDSESCNSTYKVACCE